MSHGKTRSQHDHNKSMLHSNKPKFKENIRENIYKDEMPEDGVLFNKIPEDRFIQVIDSIRSNARSENIKQFKLLIISIIITLIIILLFVNKVEKEIRHRKFQNTTILNNN